MPKRTKMTVSDRHRQRPSAPPKKGLPVMPILLLICVALGLAIGVVVVRKSDQKPDDQGDVVASTDVSSKKTVSQPSTATATSEPAKTPEPKPMTWEPYGTANTGVAAEAIATAKRNDIKRGMIHKTPPDLTRGGKPDHSHDFRLGPIGANGWCFHLRPKYGASAKARQILVTAVDRGGPADGVLRPDDVILGIGNDDFSWDARKALAAAINDAERDVNGGELILKVWRNRNVSRMTVVLPVMGTYSATAPFNCAKTETIIENAVAHMKRNETTLLKPSGWINFMNGLGLLATGRDDVMPMVTKLAHGSVLKPGEKLSVEKHVSMMCWWWSYKTVFLTEYYLRTKDPKVLPTIDEYATKIAMGQSGAGTWGHTYAAKENTGYLHGHLGGYGAINQQGLTCMIALPLAKQCGIENKEVLDAIKRGDDFFRFFIGKGTIPYGDHGAAKEWFDDNGKSGSAAVFFDIMGNQKGAQFFSEMVLGSTPCGREAGHTGHFWSHLWGGVGAARGGEKGLTTYMKEMSGIFTLERQPDGRFAFQENAGERIRNGVGDPKTKWDCTGSRLLQLCVPKRATYVTGKVTPKETHLTDERIEQVLAAGRLDCDVEARNQLTEDAILKLLEDPLPPVRSIGAKALADGNINIVDKLIPLLESSNKYARYGAAEALCKAGYASKPAADKLISLMDKDKDILFKSYAIDALINRDTRKGLLTVAKPAIPVLLRMAVKYTDEDPRKVLQQRIALGLFYKWSAQRRVGLLHKYGLDGVDRALLIPAMKEILTNENGGARSLMRWVYPKLTATELDQLWGDVYLASKHIAPSGIMFASDIRTAGLNAMADHHVREGLDLAVWYIRYQKGHGGKARIPAALQAILKYGAYAKRVIPEMESHAKWFEGKRNMRAIKRTGIPKDDPAVVIRAAIKKIQAFNTEPTFKLVSIKKHIDTMPKGRP